MSVVRGIVHPSGKFYYATVGVNNVVSAYAINTANGALTPVAGSPFATGSVPSTIAIDPSGKYLYVTNRSDNTISAYAVDATTGALSPVAGSPFGTGQYPFSITIAPSGKFVYVGSRYDGDVWIYAIDATSGALTTTASSPIYTSDEPWAVAIAPGGKFGYITNTTANTVAAYTVDTTTGAFTQLAGPNTSTGNAPTSIGFDPSGKFAYVVNTLSNNIAAYNIDASTGALNAITGGTYSVGQQSRSLVWWGSRKTAVSGQRRRRLRAPFSLQLDEHRDTGISPPSCRLLQPNQLPRLLRIRLKLRNPRRDHKPRLLAARVHVRDGREGLLVLQRARPEQGDVRLVERLSPSARIAARADAGAPVVAVTQVELCEWGVAFQNLRVCAPDPHHGERCAAGSALAHRAVADVNTLVTPRGSAERRRHPLFRPAPNSVGRSGGYPSGLDRVESDDHLRFAIHIAPDWHVLNRRGTQPQTEIAV
ncbi:hypothetical protein CJO82_08575 [Ralstonia solanacearum]|nr:YncE family protein [Ralstonia solanacearum]AXW05905.1 hypothetical protein CJO82_08575 [Ralstonia solanacearum]